MTFRALLHRVYARLARSRAVVRLVRRLRNQCRTLVGYHVTGLAGSIDQDLNGEALLARAVAPHVRRFVDVGANVGEWAALVEEATGGRAEGVLLEPSTTALARLRERFAGVDRLTVVGAAVADPASPAELTFFEEPAAGQTSTLVADARTPGSVARTVPVVTLDAQLRDLGWPGADLVKIDVEGFDLHVLRGAAGLLADHRLGIIQFEYNSHWLGAGSTLWGALELLRGAGYEVHLLTARGLMGFRYADLEEFYTYANFVAVAPAHVATVAPLRCGALEL
jgi:FkbM family methyltransferase